MTVEEKKYPGGISLVTLANSRGMTVELSNLGAGIVSVVVPDKQGRLADVALGYRTPDLYSHDGPCMGKIPGRYANRIARGLFSLDGREYSLAINNGPNALHGGPEGFQNRLWSVELLSNGVRFTYVSADGEEGYPGRVKAVAEYTLSREENRLDLDLRAETDKPTVINLTNHTYWNLKGEDRGDALGHVMTMKASHYLPTDEGLIPTGEPAPVAGTPMDFTSPKALGRDIKADFPALKFAKGYDSSWTIDAWEPGKFQEAVVRLEEPESGRILEIGTDQPAAHVYTGNWLTGSPKAKGSREYQDYDGVAVEMQGFPDAPNQPAFPSQRLNPGEEYHRKISFTFL